MAFDSTPVDPKQTRKSDAPPPLVGVVTGASAGRAPERSIGTAINAALAHLARIQSEEGSFKGDYGGPLFMLPMYVGTTYAVGFELDDTTREGMIRYLRGVQNKDGGFGLHVEAASYVFTSTLCYVALRLLGVSADDPAVSAARRWILAHGGPLASAPWGKFFLSVLGLYEYEGLDPLLPELWLLPEALPVHPSRFWCHCRMVYLPMSWLYGKRARVTDSALLREIRSELYETPYAAIDWSASRKRVSPTDAQVPRSPLVRTLNQLLGGYESLAPKVLRERALAFVLDQIRQEDENTRYICIGPVNKLLHVLVWHFERPGGQEVRAHLAQLPEYLWKGADGIKMNGYNSSELWDTAFAAQAMVASGRTEEHLPMMRSAFDFIDQNQVLEDTPQAERYFRHRSKGGWPFSTRAHGWPISDCTAEGLKAALALEPFVEAPLSEERLVDAVELILSMQNRDGGWATYELTRGPKWLELLNPSDCFADIMIDYSYVECTSSCLQALARFRERFPGSRASAIASAMERGARFLEEAQRPDGSWEGSWGVCFTYGTWFGVWGLLAAGRPAGHPSVAAACQFLLSKQAEDGSWGETPESCRLRRYVPAEKGQAVMTSWAVLALIKAGLRDTPEVQRALQFLVERQRPDGSYPEEHIAGMFNKTSGIHYDHYLDVFPLWALSLGQ
ncbi:terpene cyclase/mutase family protein [Archangium sp.]|uniref:terpene cyclase/mutase family protein n=1 Tax=Archangium sp. TaxID=1872627 RepID=UPI002D61B447|nr:terpene cyclase/mutase family protein [Archangium sp.]HYO52033.1 terpene cyclase/mutase family protein [Archangium sp.]